MKSYTVKLEIGSEYLETFHIKCNEIKLKDNIIYADGIEINFNDGEHEPSLFVCSID